MSLLGRKRIFYAIRSPNNSSVSIFMRTADPYKEQKADFVTAVAAELEKSLSLTTVLT